MEALVYAKAMGFYLEITRRLSVTRVYRGRESSIYKASRREARCVMLGAR